MKELLSSGTRRKPAFTADAAVGRALLFMFDVSLANESEEAYFDKNEPFSDANETQPLYFLKCGLKWVEFTVKTENSVSEFR